jgi:hypothetical protein
VKLLPIADDDISQAVGLLVHGFPRATEAFWRQGIERARDFMPKDTGWPLGYLLDVGKGAAGVILTFPSYRYGEKARPRLVVNLSSWYVAVPHRGVAPMMLIRLLADDAPVYTDLSPSPAVLKILEHLDFTPWNEGVVIASWPQVLAAPGRQSSIQPLSRLPQDALPAKERKILEDHRRLGCLAAALHDGTTYHPLIFLRTRLRGIPVGHLIYAHSRELILANLRPVTAFLLRNGIPLFSMDADRRECPRGAFFRPWGIKAFRGAFSRDRIDFAYSELVYLNLNPYSRQDA